MEWSNKTHDLLELARSVLTVPFEFDEIFKPPGVTLKQSVTLC